ncbi:MAG: hypothetical protein HXX20_16595 [Chloroflexi bacterium]|nr:hypothetical protein [Chloroflexota bacterium]
MSLVEKPEQVITKKKWSVLKQAGFLKWPLEEWLSIKRGLAAYPLYALLLGSVILFTLAYQVPLDYQFKLGPGFTADYLYAVSFNKPESNGDFGFRWSSEESYLRFPGVGVLPHSTLEIAMQVGGRPPNLPLPRVAVWVDQLKIGEVIVGPGEQIYRFDYQPDGHRLNGNLYFTLTSTESFQAKDHNLPLGVVVTSVQLRGSPQNNRPVIPALPQLALLLAGLVVIYLALVRAGWSSRGAARWSSLIALSMTVALALFRLQLTPALETLFLTLLVAYPLLVLGLRTTKRWLGEDKLQWVGLLFLATFTVKAAGLNHPAFLIIDHWFRIHQILRFWDTPAAFWQQYYNVSTGETVTGIAGGSAVLGQWGLSFSLPYSPLFYLFAAPLARIWPTHDPNLLAAVNLLVTWLEASSIFLIYIIACEAYRGVWAKRAGNIAAALYGFYPLSFLLFSDGGYNSILAHWLTLLFVALLFKSFNRVSSLWLNVALVISLAAALLAHTSTLLLLGSLMVVSTLLFFLQTLAKGNTPTEKKGLNSSGLVVRLSLVSLGGFGLAFALYYGWYIIPFVRDSLPTLLSKFSNGGIGQERKLLGTELLSGFWPQLWEHFRLFPFLLTLMALVFLSPFRPKSISQTARLAEYARREVWLFWLAWLVVFLLFALLDLKVNLLQKHMLFAAPLLCLGTGFALSLLWEWAAPKNQLIRWTSGLFIGGLVTFILWQGVALWYARVFYYTLPPGSG